MDRTFSSALPAAAPAAAPPNPPAAAPNVTAKTGPIPGKRRLAMRAPAPRPTAPPNDATDGFSHAWLFCVLRWHCLLDNRVRCVWCQNNYLIALETRCLQ